MNQQDLVWVKLPFTSLEESKTRPAVVVSNNDYNKKQDDVVVCAVTSKLEETPYSVFIEQRNLSTGRLPVKSKIRGDKIMQVEKTLIIRSFGKLDDETFDALIGEITNLVKRGQARKKEELTEDQDDEKKETAESQKDE